MIKLTDILTKPVLSLNHSKCEGIVKTGIFNQTFKKLKALVLFDNEENNEDKILQTQSIYSSGENAIIIKDDEYLTPFVASTSILDKPSPINSSVYTYLGLYLGKVTDVVLTDNFFVHSIIVEEKEIEEKNIISCGENIIIVQDENKKIKVSNLKRKKAKSVNIQNLQVSENQKVYILSPANSKSNSENAIQQKENQTQLALNLETSQSQIPQNSENLNSQTPSPIVFNEISQMSPLENLSSSSQNNYEVQKPKIVYSLTETPSQPGLVISNFEFLIGRKLEQNIYSSNNELIAKKNTKITTDTIIKARLFNKTRDLVKFSH